MNVLVYLIPVSLTLGGLALLGFFWAIRTRQFDDPDGDSQRFLTSEYDENPKE
ncbi:MAG: cbb3-type cytochrome oxidase assembly protein CcoS [Paracoccaceae bacterium]